MWHSSALFVHWRFHYICAASLPVHLPCLFASLSPTYKVTRVWNISLLSCSVLNLSQYNRYLSGVPTLLKPLWLRLLLRLHVIRSFTSDCLSGQFTVYFWHVCTGACHYVQACLFIQFMLFSDVRLTYYMSFMTSWLSGQIEVYLSDSPPRGGLLILCWQAWSSVHNFYFRHEARVLYVIYDILIIMSDRSSFSLTLHRVGACSSYVDKHDLQCIIFISDPSFAYPYYYPCCHRYCFLLTGCSAIGVNGLSTSTHLSSYMEHLSHSWTPYLCQGLICTQLFSRYSSLWLPLSCVHSHQKHYRHVIYMMLDMDFITYFLYLLERTVSFNPGSGVPKGFSRYTA